MAVLDFLIPTRAGANIPDEWGFSPLFFHITGLRGKDSFQEVSSRPCWMGWDVTRLRQPVCLTILLLTPHLPRPRIFRDGRSSSRKLICRIDCSAASTRDCSDSNGSRGKLVVQVEVVLVAHRM
jgi:hypothetical protein